MVSLFVNEFIIKEIRRTLKTLQISQENITYAVDYILECCTVRKNVPKSLFSRFDIRDKNDIPILAGAVHEKAVLVTEDSVLRDAAERYIESATPSEALKKLSNYGN